VLAAAVGGQAFGVTRDLAEVPSFSLTFGRSVLNQLTFDTYRTPFDELQTRPYNLLFANIARQPNFGAWPGQQGSYARYVDALIGNNGAANVDNDADAIEGSMIRRERRPSPRGGRQRWRQPMLRRTRARWRSHAVVCPSHLPGYRPNWSTRES
jgi:hypothetical protein